MTARTSRAMPLLMLTSIQNTAPLKDSMLARLLAAPFDDEAETDEEREAVARIEANIRAGRHGCDTAKVLSALDRDD